MEILLVEDSAPQRLVMARLLGNLGHSVTAVPDAETAQSHLHGCDAIITDLILPGLSGAAWVAAIRLAAANIVIVVVSAGPAAIAGADVVLAKPVSAAQLSRALAGAPTGGVTTRAILDFGQLSQLQAHLGHREVNRLVTRFMAEADRILTEPAPDSVSLHHLAGSAGMFGAQSLHAALLQGFGKSAWPATRQALLQLLDQPA